MTKENNIEQKFIDKLIEQKYTYRPDIRTRDALNQKNRNTERVQESFHTTTFSIGEGDYSGVDK